jgi:ParB family transcriptional regulator, chromosome partitioning protein
MPSEKPTRRLGRGLEALFNTPRSTAGIAREGEEVRRIPLAQISRNPFQPRRNFRPAEQLELRESLKSSGLLQPIAVRPKRGEPESYELIAGERRLRAANDLGWKSIDAIVKSLDDREMLTLALIENLQREDLNPLEEAEGYERLISDFAHSQQSVAELVGKDRSTVANALRLLQLPEQVRDLVRDGSLAAGHVRPLLALRDDGQMLELARAAAKGGWSAREMERRVRQLDIAPQKGRRGRPRSITAQPLEIKEAEERLRKRLQTDVGITVRPGGAGSIALSFYSTDDLERLLEVMGIPVNPH